MSATLNRLSRRGTVTIVAKDGTFDVTLKTPGPYRGRGSCSTDEADFWDYLHLGATNWRGSGADLDALLACCEEETRPRWRDIDDLVWAIESRRDTRTTGPPLPSYRRWHGWSPGIGRWLRTHSHAYEYLAGYERDRRDERKFEAERAADEARRLHRRATV